MYDLSVADWWHHLLFMPTIAIPGLVYNWRALGNVQLFFICGLPGAIIYTTLITERVVPMRRIEPYVSAFANTLRMPGILYAKYAIITLSS